MSYNLPYCGEQKERIDTIAEKIACILAQNNVRVCELDVIKEYVLFYLSVVTLPSAGSSESGRNMGKVWRMSGRTAP